MALHFKGLLYFNYFSRQHHRWLGHQTLTVVWKASWHWLIVMEKADSRLSLEDVAKGFSELLVCLSLAELTYLRSGAISLPLYLSNEGPWLQPWLRV